MNYLIYPIKVMNITQTYENDFSHLRHTVGTPKDYPIDDNCGESGANGYFYCPCDEMIVKKIYGVGTSSTNVLWLESTTKVIAPTFNDYVTIMIGHIEDSELNKLSIGQKFRRKEAIAIEGRDGNATGEHFHIVVGKGKFAGSGWVKNTNNILKIESRVFEGCTNLKEFVLPDNIESVGNSILYNGNKNLFTKYENGYYLGTKTNPYLWLVDLEDKDISTLTINKDTKYLAPYSCAYTTKLKELIVPSNIEEIGYGAFYNSKALEKVTFEDGVKKIDDKAFMRSENLKQIKFTNTINTLGEAAFAYCTNLDNINIPSSIFNLSNDLFNNCLSLKNLTIPNSIKYISNSCFLR